MSESDKQLEKLRADHRATARYSIYRHRLAANNYHRVKESLDYVDLTWEQATSMCDTMNLDARVAAGDPSDCWGLTQYYPSLKPRCRRAGPRLKRPNSQTGTI